MTWTQQTGGISWVRRGELLPQRHRADLPGKRIRIYMNQNKEGCCERCKTYGIPGKIFCSNPSCPCHRTKGCKCEEDNKLAQALCPLHGAAAYREPQESEEYEKSDASHYHCWESAEPPCGQRIEHLKCCLCERLNHRVSTLIKAEREKQDVQSTLNGYYQGRTAAFDEIAGVVKKMKKSNGDWMGDFIDRTDFLTALSQLKAKKGI